MLPTSVKPLFLALVLTTLSTPTFAFDAKDVQIGAVEIKQVDTGYSQDLAWSVSITNESQIALSGIDLEIALFTDRVVPVRKDRVFELVRIPGGINPGETIAISDRLRDAPLTVRLHLTPENLRGELSVLDIADADGFSLLCKPHPRDTPDDYLGPLSYFDGPSPLSCPKQ